VELRTSFPNEIVSSLRCEPTFGELTALGAALSWTASALLYRKALQETQPISANVVRLVLTSTILIAFIAVVGKLGSFATLPYNVVVLAAVSGIIGLGVGDTLYMVSLKMVGVARAVPITCTYPLFTLLFAFTLAGQPPALTVSLGAVLIVVGIWLVSIERDSNATASRKLLLFGVVMGLATAMLWAVSITMMNLAVNYNRQLDSALAVNTIRVTTMGATFAASAPLLYKRHRLTRMSRKTVLFLIAGGLVALGLGWFFLSYSLTVTDESRAVPISSVTPLFSTLTAVLLFHERITMENALGSVMIVIGIFTIFLL
jgi:DME family drug/metabolite transporter